jgi:hypothetical protein
MATAPADTATIRNAPASSVMTSRPGAAPSSATRALTSALPVAALKTRPSIAPTAAWARSALWVNNAATSTRAKREVNRWAIFMLGKIASVTEDHDKRAGRTFTTSLLTTIKRIRRTHN